MFEWILFISLNKWPYNNETQVIRLSSEKECHRVAKNIEITGYRNTKKTDAMVQYSCIKVNKLENK